MEREACVCDHGFERSDLCAEIIIIQIMVEARSVNVKKTTLFVDQYIYANRYARKHEIISLFW